MVPHLGVISTFLFLAKPMKTEPAPATSQKPTIIVANMKGAMKQRSYFKELTTLE